MQKKGRQAARESDKHKDPKHHTPEASRLTVQSRVVVWSSRWRRAELLLRLRPILQAKRTSMHACKVLLAGVVLELVRGRGEEGGLVGSHAVVWRQR